MSANKNNKPRNMGNCEMCYYWKSRENERAGHGICHRFPEGMDTRIEYYCGEFVLKSISFSTETERPKTGDAK